MKETYEITIKGIVTTTIDRELLESFLNAAIETVVECDNLKIKIEEY